VTGCLISALPWLTAKLNYEALWLISFLATPGTIVAMLLSGWNVHDYSYAALMIGNIGFYALLVYGCLHLSKK